MSSFKKDFLAGLYYYRKEDMHECKLINARMSWMIYMQTLLITSYFIIATNSDQVFVLYNSLLLFAIAVYFALSLGKTVRAAEKMILAWHYKEKRLFKSLETIEDPLLKQDLESFFVADKYGATDEEDLKNSNAFSLNKTVTPVIIVFWFGLLVFSCFNFIHHQSHGAADTTSNALEKQLDGR
ncbi:MAG TPA: hypothetical protein VFT64_07820 [Rickettsiales bacterium]|nr:hypothetical protein [Rickettsiales bacterium]